MSAVGPADAALRTLLRAAGRRARGVHLSAPQIATEAARDASHSGSAAPGASTGPGLVGGGATSRHLSLVPPVGQDDEVLDEYGATSAESGHDVGSNQQSSTAAKSQGVESPAEVAVNQAIADYRPRDISDEDWAVIGPFVRAAVTRCEGKTPHRAQIMLGVASGLAYWCWKIAGIPLEDRYAFRHDIITSYTNHLKARTEYTNATVATYRSSLMRMADILMGTDSTTYRLPALRTNQPVAPFDWEQQIALRSWAAGQATYARRIGCTVLLAGCLGAGLSATELLGLTAGDVQVDELGVLLDIAGKRPRTAPVLAEWETVIADVATASWKPEQWIFLPRRTTCDVNRVHRLIRSSNDKPFPINAQRLRSTWIVTQLIAGVPVQAILEASGIETLSGLGRFLEFAPGVDPNEARSALTQRARAEGCMAPRGSAADPYRGLR